jgi:hypothetical protein
MFHSHALPKTLVTGVILLSLFLGGCTALAKPTPTAIPPTSTPIPPTDTPAPTDTPEPTATNTPSPTPTATPDYQATQLAQQEKAARDVLTQLKLPTDSGKIGWYQTEEVAIDLDGPDAHYDTVSDLKNAGDFVFFTEFSWNTNSWPVCGVIFRSDNRWTKGDYYVAQFLRYSGLPAWDIEYNKDGDWVNAVTQEVRYSSYLNLDSGDKNEIILAAVGNEFKMWINNNFEGRYYDDSKRLSDGGLAFLAWQDSGKTTCAFKNSWIWIYK